MPYNLRKRKAPIEDPLPVKKRTTQDAPAVKKKLSQDPPPAKKKSVQDAPAVKKRLTQDLPPEKKEPIKDPPLVKKRAIKAEVVPEKPDATRRQLMFGADSCGELGQGKIGISRKSPIQVCMDKPIKQVACGPMHTLSLTEDGQVFSYGCNDEGALGRETDGDEELEATPTIVPIEDAIVKITAGDSHSAVLTIRNEVFIWGNFRDEHGSVGLTPSCEGRASYKPLKVLSDKKLKDIASGSNHMLLLDDEGEVYSFGVGAQGQLGRLSREELESDGNSHPINESNRELFLTPQKVSFKNVDPQRQFICDAIFAGNFSSFATNTDKKKNRLAGWGLNNYFQLGYKGQKGQLIQHTPRRSTFTCSTSMVHVACGQHHTLFLTRTGRLYAAGRHEYGMLGLGKLDKEVCPAKVIDKLEGPILNISAGINTSFAVSNQGNLFSWGMGGLNLGLQSDDDLTTPTRVESLVGKKVISVSAGGSFTAVIVDAD